MGVAPILGDFGEEVLGGGRGRGGGSWGELGEGNCGPVGGINNWQLISSSSTCCGVA